MYRLFYTILTIIPCLLCGGVQDHLKTITEKNPVHSMLNIDYIYMINLDQRPEKFKASLDQLTPYGIVPYRFSAVNGWELTGEDINDLGVQYEPWMAGKMRRGLWGTFYSSETDLQPQHEVISVPGRTYFCHCMARGPIGICLSHLSILQDAWDAGFNAVWIMEDDIAVIKDPRQISSLIEELDRAVGAQGWDILFTDQDTKNNAGNYVPCTAYAHRPNFAPARPERFAQRHNVGRTFRKIGARYGAYSYIIRRSGMEKILNHFKTHKIFLPFDMEFYLPVDIRMFCVQDDVVSTTPNALSDNGGPNYKSKLQ